jgi:Tol biopolymer transport system component
MLSLGERLGQYEVVEPLGVGGMGEVYRAFDTRLARDVALKVLPAGSLADAAARRRFRKEALALSRLSHPHIASLFDFDTTGDRDFLVMELVPGPSLDTKLKRGPLLEKDVVRLGAQVTRALVAAHAQGVIHRDLKPSNIKLTADGLAKVLDFGLARFAPALGDDATTDTATGIAAGTPPYMSPEQLLAKGVDERTDVYAAGVVLYEMATGKRPFGDATGPQLVAMILNEPAPPPRRANPAISPALEQVILKASDKEKELRHPSAKDLLVDLERLAAGTSVSAGRGPASTGRPRYGSLTWRRVLAAALALIGVAIAFARGTQGPSSPRIASTRVLVRVEPTGLETDGVNVYYSTRESLMAIPIQGGQARRIEVPWRENVGILGLKRDPTVLLVAHDSEVWRVPLGGEAPVRLGGPAAIAGATWSPQGDRLAWVESREEARVLCVGDPEGRDCTALAEGPRHATYEPVLSIVGWHPSGKWLRYYRGGETPRLVDVRPDGRVRSDVPYRPLPDEWSIGPAWTPDGAFWLFGTQRGMVAVPERDPWAAWLARAASPELIGGPTHAFTMRFTPEGRRLVAFLFRPSAEVFRLNADTGAAGPVVMDGTRSWTLVYSPDGTRVAWISGDTWPGRLFVGRADGTQRLPVSDLEVHAFGTLTWSPDGRYVAFTTDLQRAGAKAPHRLYLASPGDGKVEPLTSAEPDAPQFDACWSPDGRWLAYGGNGPPATGKDAYLRRVNLATREVTRLAGSEGLWSPRCAADGRILAMDLLAQEAESRSTKPGPRRAHFKLRHPATGQWTPMAVDLPSGVTSVSYPSWSRGGRQVYMNAGRWLVRWGLATGRLAVVADLTGFGGEFPGAMGLDPDDNPLVTRDMTDREIVVMDVEAR